MARPERRDVDYFPFFAKRGRTLNILQSKFGLEGIGFFTNLMRFLALTPDHHYCIKDEADRMNFFTETGLQDEAKGIEMIEIMATTGKIEKELWENHRVIVSEAFLESIKDAYRLRANEIVTIEKIKEKYVSNVDNPQTKLKKTKVKKTKVNSEAAPPGVSENPPSSKPEKANKAPLREREPANDMERVEKAYLLNWDGLYAQGKVKAVNPVVNWNQTRKLLKTRFKNLTAEIIIRAVNNGMNDDWVLNTGYSLGTMLSASVLNRLINVNGPGPPRHRIAADNVSQEKVSSYFKEAE
jgi:hypothetical protein